MICSATHNGLRVRRSNADVVESVGRRSEIGPGNPYWNRPFGFTGGASSLSGRGADDGTGGSGKVAVEVEGIVVEGNVLWLLSRFRFEKTAAVVAAPAAADMPAMTANVVLDIFRAERRFLQLKVVGLRTYVLT